MEIGVYPSGERAGRTVRNAGESALSLAAAIGSPVIYGGLALKGMIEGGSTRHRQTQAPTRNFMDGMPTADRHVTEAYLSELAASSLSGRL